MLFSELGLIPPLASAVAEEGYTEPTPIQQRAIPHVLAGKDLLGLAQTGTGKTAAFALPILQRLAAGPGTTARRPIRCLILTPTRELASQIGESFSTYGKNLPLRNTVIFGGVGMEPQKQALRQGMDVLIATPGRLLDLMGQGLVELRSLEVFVLDEADRMLDMGFIHDVKKVIAKLPHQRQTLFFSATMPPEAQQLADQLLKNPETVAVTPPSTTAEKVDQEVFFVEKADKRALLVEVLGDQSMKRVLVFSRTKHGANRIAEHLTKERIEAEAIHGNKSQNARERALAGFKSGRLRVLVATDIAARGIDVDSVTHVVNFDVPEVPETYVHRIGRTARAGASGMAMTFCDSEERQDLRNIEKLTRQAIPLVEGHPYESRNPAPTEFDPRNAHNVSRGGGSDSRSRGQRDSSEGRPPRGRNDRARGGGGGGRGPRSNNDRGPRPASDRGPQQNAGGFNGGGNAGGFNGGNAGGGNGGGGFNAGGGNGGGGNSGPRTGGGGGNGGGGNGPGGGGGGGRRRRRGGGGPGPGAPGPRSN
ncbi:MAG TPA: DEAD/DEAH box helicase [Kofleriaceae bacterium]|jgi:ATP-dependent RNA helicase RhlE